LLVSFPPLSNMLKSSGSSCQSEARLGGYRSNLDGVNHNRGCIIKPRQRSMLSMKTTYHAGRDEKHKSVLRCVSSLQATQLNRRLSCWDGPSFRRRPAGPTQWQPDKAKTRRVRTTGTQTGMLPGISRKRNMRSKF
jgi:hypothetical protein